MKTKEELLALRAEAEALKKKLAELNEDELAQVTGGWYFQEYEVTLEQADACIDKTTKQKGDFHS